MRRGGIVGLIQNVECVWLSRPRRDIQRVAGCWQTVSCCFRSELFERSFSHPSHIKHVPSLTAACDSRIIASFKSFDADPRIPNDSHRLISFTITQIQRVILYLHCISKALFYSEKSLPAEILNNTLKGIAQELIG